VAVTQSMNEQQSYRHHLPLGAPNQFNIRPFTLRTWHPKIQDSISDPKGQGTLTTYLPSLTHSPVSASSLGYCINAVVASTTSQNPDMFNVEISVLRAAIDDAFHTVRVCPGATLVYLLYLLPKYCRMKGPSVFV